MIPMGSKVGLMGTTGYRADVPMPGCDGLEDVSESCCCGVSQASIMYELSRISTVDRREFRVLEYHWCPYVEGGGRTALATSGGVSRDASIG